MEICLVRVLLCLTESPHLNITTNSYINNADSLLANFPEDIVSVFHFQMKETCPSTDLGKERLRRS